ncbi:hypothetical protein [Actinomadura alba]|uniref:Uncharacterized protein n=1 Tax=Actinomadura alba TaxID=406431 RepID=A0ABR7LUD0_9ACTN|nr:hypothetical protein [Actinomadura alba]MBC6468013.1 hypothetical protein [Actinomadura alba]
MPVPRARQIVLAAAERRRLKQLAYSRTAPFAPNAIALAGGAARRRSP